MTEPTRPQRIARRLPKGHPLRRQVLAAKTDGMLWLVLMAVIGMAVAGGIFALRDVGSIWLWALAGTVAYFMILAKFITPQLERQTAIINALLEKVRLELLRIDGGDRG